MRCVTNNVFKVARAGPAAMAPEVVAAGVNGLRRVAASGDVDPCHPMKPNLSSRAVCILFYLSALVLGLIAPLGAQPVALVLEHEDPFLRATGTARLLQDAGFVVKQPDLKKSLQARGISLIVIGSFAGENPAVARYLKENKANLQRFVEAGGVVVQFTAADQTEPTAVYLPAPLSVRRVDDDLAEIYALAPTHLLLDGIEFVGPNHQLNLPPYLTDRPPVLEVFDQQAGFAVLLSTDRIGMFPVLLEGAHGKGRFILSSWFIDKQYQGDRLVAPDAYQKVARTFLRNVRRYVKAIQGGAAPAVDVMPPAARPMPGAWNLVLLPDTQYYLNSKNPRAKPELFLAQTQWIARQQAERNIRYVLHLGDVTQNNLPAEWAQARQIMRELDGRVPYAIVGGNHDYGPNGTAADRSTYLSEYFSPQQFVGTANFGGTMQPGKMDNNFHYFEAGGVKWLIVGLEWAARDLVVPWANDLIAKHPDHRVILLTHAYLYYDNTRYDFEAKGKYDPVTTQYEQVGTPRGTGGTGLSPEGSNDGETLWRNLASKHANVALVICGHALGDGLGYLASTGEAGNVVHQLLVNFQGRKDGGEGYLRTLEFWPDGRTIRVRDYSPALGRFLSGDQSQFDIHLDR